MIGKFLNEKSLHYAIGFFLVFFVWSAATAQAQVAVDNRSAGGAFSNTGVTTLSWTHTVGSGSNRALFVGISATSQAATTPITSLPTVPLTNLNFTILSVTDNGVPMQQVAFAAAIDRQVGIYQLVNPPTGANNIVVTFTAGTVTNASGNSVSFTGVNQTAPNANAVSELGNSNAPATTISGAGITADDMAFDALASTPNAGFFAAGAGQTVCTDAADETTCTRGRRFFFNSYDVGATSTETGNEAGVVMSWTMTNAQPWALSAVAVKAAPPVTAAGVMVAGRVVSTEGRGVGRITLKLTASDGSMQTVKTNPFGHFRFENVAAGQNITLEGFSKQYRIVAQTISVYENIADLNLTVEP